MGKVFVILIKEKIDSIAICRDGRLSSPEISKALVKGVLESGVNVIDIGCGPTPMLYFASVSLQVDAAIMVTGSHNPKNHNGFKIVLKNKSFYGSKYNNCISVLLTKSFKMALVNLLQKT